MKLHPPHADSEKKANALWRQFSRHDQEAFWKRYEVLIQEKQSYQIGDIKQTTPNSSTTNFRPTFFYPTGGWLLKVIFLTIFPLILFSVFIYRMTEENSTLDPNLWFLLLLFALLFALCFNEFWELNSFHLSQKSLVINKQFFGVKRQIAWYDIKSITIEKRKVSNETYRVMIINTYQTQQKTFKFPISYHDRRKFIRLIEAKGVTVKDDS
ncbi:hypothetical protein BKI52_00805 [marine bacterium AO1-C]|nr:hypothetical protein BKI52_00805 [marine bacterium AO1-C]